MRKRLTTAAFLWSMAATASAQSGAEITMPPNARQAGIFPFANSCPTGQTFKISAPPSQDWLRVEPATVRAAPGTAFGVRVTVNSAGNRSLGKYRGNVTVVCISCAATDPPCLQDAKEFPIAMTVADVRAPGEFSPMAAPSAPPSAPTTRSAVPRPVIPPDPSPSMGSRLVPWVGIGLLAAALAGGIIAMRGLFLGRPKRVAAGEMSAESERHTIRR